MVIFNWQLELGCSWLPKNWFQFCINDIFCAYREFAVVKCCICTQQSKSTLGHSWHSIECFWVISLQNWLNFVGLLPNCLTLLPANFIRSGWDLVVCCEMCRMAFFSCTHCKYEGGSQKAKCGQYWEKCAVDGGSGNEQHKPIHLTHPETLAVESLSVPHELS